MEKLMADNFNKVRYTESQLLLLSQVVLSSQDATKLLNLILKNTVTASNKNAKGITKMEMRNQLNLSKHACNNALNLLLGGALVYYTEIERRKYYQLTIRGADLVIFMRDHNINTNNSQI